MFVVDLHCDALWNVYKNAKDGNDVSLTKNHFHVDFEKLKKGKVAIQCFALFNIPQESQPFKSANVMIDYLERDVKGRDDVKIVHSYKDIEKNISDGVTSALITMEDAFMIERDYSKLQALYERGLRMICLNHNVVNGVGHPNLTFSNGKTNWQCRNEERGLTDFGFELVKKMNDMGVIVDVSHLSDKGFYDVIKTTTKPIIASHSNACGVTDVPRNLTDDMLKKLADNGGVTGMCFAPKFLDSDEEKGRDAIACVLRHVDYIKKLIGVDYVALGSDFDGVDLDIDCSFYPDLIKAFIEHGYKDSEIEKICYANALRVFKANLK